MKIISTSPASEVVVSASLPLYDCALSCALNGGIGELLPGFGFGPVPIIAKRTKLLEDSNLSLSDLSSEVMRTCNSLRLTGSFRVLSAVQKG